MKILVVCLGNICRSPIGEGVFRQFIAAEGLNWTVHSAGTNRYHKGGPADPRSVAACERKGVSIQSHIARRLKSEDFDHYDIIFTMADDVTDEMQEFIRTPDDRKKIVNFLDSLYPKQNRNVPDPWYGELEGFDECYDLIEQAARAWMTYWLKDSKENGVKPTTQSAYRRPSKP